MIIWLLLAVVLVLVYLYATRNNAYFKKKGMHFESPTLFVGNMGSVVLRRIAYPYLMKGMYDANEGRAMFGTFEFTQPVTVVRDPEVIRLITVKHSEYFMDHRHAVTEDVEPLIGKNLVSLQGQRWKNMRSTLSPAFTSSKMKAMFLLVEKCGQQMTDYLAEQCRADGSVVLDMKDFFSKYANDVIATAAFGVHVNSLAQSDNEFLEMGKQVFNPPPSQMLVLLVYMVAPRLMKVFNMTLLPARINKFFRALITDSMKMREEQGIVRPDMIHLLMQAQRGKLRPDESGDAGEQAVLSNDDITAQALLFFLAGFDNTATLLCFTCHLLAVHEDVQSRVQREIDDAMAAEEGKLTYEGMQSLKYLDQVISETLRMYPVAPIADRKCVKTYKMAATQSTPEFTVHEASLDLIDATSFMHWRQIVELEDDVTNSKTTGNGDGFIIPIHAIHWDPEHYANPEKFDPDRFSEENKHKIKPFTYLPFGMGPRNCIGMRFAQMEAKIALACILSKYHLDAVEKTPVRLSLDPKAFNMAALGGFWLGLRPRRVVRS